MSKKVTENTEEKKVVTKYDLKMQRKEEARKKAKRDELIGRIAGIVIVAVLFCLVASFPIRSYLTVNGTYIEIAGEKVSRLEFDYNYNLMKNSFISQNGYYMSMLGMDLSGDLSAMMYSDTLTFQDYFEQLAVENIAGNKALRDKMKEAGFTYDTTEEYAEYEEALKEAAADAGVTEKAYIQQLYGAYATASRVKGFVTETLELSAYYEQLSEEKAPSEADIQAYYEEHRDDYDSVNYRIITVNAELPTEPTDLADPVEETEGTQGTEGAEGTEGSDTEAAYEPSEAEIAFAMEEAQAKAEAALETILKQGELQENVKRSAVSSLLRDWLFDSGRKAGDTTVIENTTGHLYYAVEFESRSLDQTPTADARLIYVSTDSAVSAEAILEEWKNGAATEDSFAELADKYGAATEGGLREGLTAGSMTDALDDWIFDSARTGGEAAAISLGEGQSSYVVYYVGANDPDWFLDIESTLLTERMTAYMEEISQGYEVTNARGNLNYLKVQEAEAAAAALEDASGESGGSEQESGESGESGQD
ncbi:MAG: hypothetical protein NC123_16575 [Butyrivibrio sp.]|nr:hypothetical protein [Acetatifactor muris]MCM1561134.1 hypothetical protein [Butyrivibrio sp.]